MTAPLTPRIIPAENGDATPALQAALDAARSGPIHICLGPGIHNCSGLRLYSDTVLEISKGATLRFDTRYEAYAQNRVDVSAEQSDRAMIVAKGETRITICGAGEITCDGAAAFSTGEDAEMGTRIPAPLRPRVVVLDKCTDIELRDLSISDAPMWTLHLVDCDRASLSNLTILNDLRMPNTDGIVLDGCRDVQIRNSTIRTADDGIVLKTSARQGGGTVGPCRAISVTCSTVESRSCALKIGTESYSDFTDITFEDCTVEQSNRALGIFSRDGGTISNIRFARIRLTCFETPDGFWGSGEPITVIALDRRPETRPAGAIRNVTFREISGTAPGAICLYAERAGLIETLSFDGINLAQIEGPLGTAHRYDLRPTPADLAETADTTGRMNAWRKDETGTVIGLTPYPDGLPTLFAHKVQNLRLTHLDIQRPPTLPDGWSTAPICIDPT